MKYGVGLMRSTPQRRRPPSRGAWIEMLKAQDTAQARDVAPLAGGVD